MGSKWKLRWSNDVNQDKNDFDGSNPTAEMPKISFSCGSHTPAVSNLRTAVFFTAKMPAFAMDIYFVNISHLTESGRNLRSGLSFYFAFCLRLQWVSVLSTLPIVKAAISFKDCGFLILFIYITRLKRYNEREII